MRPGYEILDHDRVSGPHSLVALRQMAEIYVLTPQTPVRLPARAGATPDAWRPISELPELHADLFPPRATPAPRLAGGEGPAPIDTLADARRESFDVLAIQRDNSARLRACEDDLLRDIGERPNLRRRDYLVCFVALNLFVAGAGQVVGYLNPFLIGLAVIGNLGLAWVLYGVMSRY